MLVTPRAWHRKSSRAGTGWQGGEGVDKPAPSFLVPAQDNSPAQVIFSPTVPFLSHVPGSWGGGGAASEGNLPPTALPVPSAAHPAKQQEEVKGCSQAPPTLHPTPHPVCSNLCEGTVSPCPGTCWTFLSPLSLEQLLELRSLPAWEQVLPGEGGRGGGKGWSNRCTCATHPRSDSDPSRFGCRTSTSLTTREPVPVSCDT